MSTHPRIVQTVIDTPAVRSTAEFYRRLFGMEYRLGDEPQGDDEEHIDWVVLRHPGGGPSLAFQYVERFEPTTWPDHEVPMQLHLDCSVPTLAELHHQRGRAEDLGARLLFDRTDDADEPLYVMADPVGHPFCLFVAE